MEGVRECFSLWMRRWRWSKSTTCISTGDNNEARSFAPATLSGLLNSSQLVAGSLHTCSLFRPMLVILCECKEKKALVGSAAHGRSRLRVWGT